jgi:hypothetical protein
MSFEEANAEFEAAVKQITEATNEISRVYDTTEPSYEQSVIVQRLLTEKLEPASDRYHKAVEAVLQASSEMSHERDA